MPRRVFTGQLDPYAPIKIDTPRFDDGTLSDRKSIRVYSKEEDKWLSVGNVTETYKIVENRDLKDFMDRILAEVAPTWEQKEVTFNGKVYRQRYLLPNQMFDASVIGPGHVRINEPVGLGIDLVNSYDCTRRYSIGFNAQVMVCSNTLIVTHQLGQLALKHVDDYKELDELFESVAGMIKIAARKLEERILPNISAMAERTINTTYMKNLITSLDIPDSLFVNALRNAQGNSEWDLCQGFTAVMREENNIRHDDLNKKLMGRLFDTA